MWLLGSYAAFATSGSVVLLHPTDVARTRRE